MSHSRRRSKLRLCNTDREWGKGEEEEGVIGYIAEGEEHLGLSFSLDFVLIFIPFRDCLWKRECV